MVIAVELDISYTFNSLSWRMIKRALMEKNVLANLRVVIHSYLSDRKLLYVDEDDRVVRRVMTCGVPQGSVLGPLLWDVAYNSVLDLQLSEDCTAMWYADDALVIVSDSTVESTVAGATVAVAMIYGEIWHLGSVYPHLSQRLSC